MGISSSVAKTTLDVDGYWPSEEDVIYAALTLYGEIRNGSFNDMVAVMWVIENRRRTGRWGRTYTKVTLAPKQFSCWNIGDPNRKLLKFDLVKSKTPFLMCVLAVLSVVLGIEPDPTDGALHYAVKTMKPYWASSAQSWVDIGPHRFYRGVP